MMENNNLLLLNNNEWGGGEDAVQNLSLQVFHLQQIVGDMRNEMNLLFADQRRHISTVNGNVRRIGAFCGGGTGVLAATAAPQGRPVASYLSKCPRILFILWREWEQGIAGGKPAKLYSHRERGANKSTFSRRRIFWDLVEDLILRGHSSDMAIDKIYQAYGWTKSVTKILAEMKMDKARSVLRV
jgi:hypothetical protein